MASTATDFSLPLKGKLAIVTGGSRGLGAAMVMDLAQRGADVCIVFVSDSSVALAEGLADKIHALPHKPKAYLCQADLSTVDGAGQVISQLREQFNARTTAKLQIDILVNNAGIELDQTLAEFTLEMFDRVHNLNTRGVILMTHAVLPFLPSSSKDGRGGRIINIASVGSRTPYPGFSIYCHSKAGMEGFTRCWASELGSEGTTVNSVCPGPVQSDMLDRIPEKMVEWQKARTPVNNRLGTAEEVAHIVAWLASDDARWVTGQSISASGGFAMY